jgi:hypothetical protein
MNSRRADVVRPQRRRRLIAAVAGLAAAIAAAAALLSYRVVPPPDAARVVTDDQNQTYASTPCVLFNRIEREVIANRGEAADATKPLRLLAYANERTMAEVRADGWWHRDATCNAAAGFDQIVTLWMRLIGYRARWSDDGQWRW